jgi:hypothetical protein
MLTCVPTSLCSWNYRVRGPAGEGATTINVLSEQGSLSLGGAAYEVVKHGPMSGFWTLEANGEIVAEARKPSVMFRTVVVTCGEAALRVQAASAFTRTFELIIGESVVGSVRPVHLFTRRALMECDAAVPQLAQMFAFWLVVLSWRRTANKDSS